MQDRVLIGSIAGTIGAFTSALLSFIISFTGIVHVKAMFLNSCVFLEPASTASLASDVYGTVIHLMLGAFIGIIYIYCLPFIGERYPVYKGFLLGAASWLVVGGFVANALQLPIKSTVAVNTIYLLLNFVYGLVTVFSARYLMKKV